MALCIFCENELGSDTKPEHILLSALGGKKTTTRVICSRHNSDFGETIDDKLASQVAFLRNLHQLRSGTGKVAPALKNVKAGDRTVIMRGDGNAEIVQKPFAIVDLGEGKWSLNITARSEEHLDEIITHASRKLGVPEDSLRAQLAQQGNASIVSERLGAVQQEVRLGGPDAVRSAMKACLVFWTTVVGNDEVKSATYQQARNFVINGGEEFMRSRTHLDSRSYESVEQIKAAYGPLFNLIYVRSDERGRVIGHFTLYNVISWQMTIAESGGCPGRKIALISNPLDPICWSDGAAEEFDVPFGWFEKHDYRPERAKGRLDSVLQYYFDVRNPVEHQKILERAFEQVGVAPGEALPSDKVNDFSRVAAQRIAHHESGIPYEQELTREGTEKLLKKRED